ncbi:MAG: hypothetical protein R2728_14345 [Chitinophagales bacterium]
MTDFNNIDDLFKESQGDWNEMPSNAAWDKLSDRLGTHAVQKAHANKTIMRWSIAASVVVILGLSYFFLNISPKNYDGQLAETEKVNAPEDISKIYPKETEQEATEINTNAFVENVTAIENEETTNGTIASKTTNGNGFLADHANTPTKNSPQQINAAATKQQTTNDALNSFENDGIPDKAGEVSYMVEESIPQYLDEVIVQDDLEDKLLLDRDQTVVANYVGIQKEKAERAASAKQQKKTDQSAPKAAYAYESKDKNKGYINEINSDEDGVSANEEAVSLHYGGADAVPEKIIYIYYPIENANCQEVTIKLMKNETELHPCDDSKLLRELKNNKTLLELYELTISDYNSIEDEQVSLDCSVKKSFKIVVEYGLINNRSKATYYWNIDCPTNSNAKYIKQLEKIIQDSSY